MTRPTARTWPACLREARMYALVTFLTTLSMFLPLDRLPVLDASGDVGDDRVVGRIVVY